jgi:hypothetical protein
MKQTYAVVWSTNSERRAGRLELFTDRFELTGRDRRVSISFSELMSASIARGRSERLLGLPVLALARRRGPPIRIASLEGPGFLQELAARVERCGRAVAAI